MTLAYINFFSAIEVDSPSLVIVLKIYKAGKSGLTKESIKLGMNNETLVKPRVNDLYNAKIARLDGGMYYLNQKGAVIAIIFKYYRMLMKAEKGG